MAGAWAGTLLGPENLESKPTFQPVWPGNRFASESSLAAPSFPRASRGKETIAASRFN
jgi:hypothetical protein